MYTKRGDAHQCCLKDSWLLLGLCKKLLRLLIRGCGNCSRHAATAGTSSGLTYHTDGGRSHSNARSHSDFGPHSENGIFGIFEDFSKSRKSNNMMGNRTFEKNWTLEKFSAHQKFGISEKSKGEPEILKKRNIWNIRPRFLVMVPGAIGHNGHIGKIGPYAHLCNRMYL